MNNKFVAFFKALNRAQKAFRRFLASDVIKAEAKQRTAAMALVLPSLSNDLTNATSIGQQMTVAGQQELEAANKAAEEAKKKKAEGEAYIAAVALLSK